VNNNVSLGEVLLWVNMLVIVFMLAKIDSRLDRLERASGGGK
jgi:hypothetical protein